MSILRNSKSSTLFDIQIEEFGPRTLGDQFLVINSLLASMSKPRLMGCSGEERSKPWDGHQHMLLQGGEEYAVIDFKQLKITKFIRRSTSR